MYQCSLSLIGTLWGGGQVPLELGGEGKVAVPATKTTQPTQPPTMPQTNLLLWKGKYIVRCVCVLYWYKLCLCQQRVNKEMTQDRKWWHQRGKNESVREVEGPMLNTVYFTVLLRIPIMTNCCHRCWKQHSIILPCIGFYVRCFQWTHMNSK